MKRFLIYLAPWLLFVAPTWGAVDRIEVESRELVLQGRAFGAVGPYEKIAGTIHFVLDPKHPQNARIIDLALAPRNAAGRVEAWANFMVLHPKNVPESTALLEVSNRGRKAALGYFNGAHFSADPTTEAHFGDGFLMRLGLTVIWVGWQWDVPREPGQLRLSVPIARADDRPIQGLVRSDWTVDQLTSTLPLGHRHHVAYPVHDPDDPSNVLTVRDGRLAARRVVPREQWTFSADRMHITMPTGFTAGKIYELVYRAQDPRVVGMGFAAIRDTISYAKYDPRCPFPVKQAIALGISQTGRFLRHFLYQGFNTDEQGRQVADGMLIHTAGAGRGSFNHRFGQPSRDAHRYSAFFYPTDLFPFGSRIQRDAVTGRRDGLLTLHRQDGHVPKIFYTNTGYEYWGRAASLLHTSLDGSADVELLPEERLFHLASTQHFPVSLPPHQHHTGLTAYKGNPIDFLVTERALLVALKAWVEDNRQPPASQYPRIDNGTLVALAEVPFPQLPGVVFPKVVHEAYRTDYGEHWPQGIITKQPPELGAPFATLVPSVDRLGNEVGGVPTVEIMVPVATYTPWHLRTNMSGGVGELTDFYGTFIPLMTTEADRTRAKDPRPSLENLYPSKADYLAKLKRAARTLVQARFLLKEDEARVVRRAEYMWDWLWRSNR
jgi:hypothetical protein